MKTIDKRPDPKPRKHPHLAQAYQEWYGQVENRKRDFLRISAIEAGKSNADLTYARLLYDRHNYDQRIKEALKELIFYGQQMGPVWNWLLTIKGLGSGSLNAQLLAQIDDIALAPRVSNLWRFAGQAVFDGQAERSERGKLNNYNARLKSICFLVVDQFIRQQTPVYSDLYYQYKAADKAKHPEPIGTKYSDQHLHLMAIRKTAKVFLQHLWLVWRASEGLPLNMPYIHAIGGHTGFVMVPNLDRLPWPVQDRIMACVGELALTSILY